MEQNTTSNYNFLLVGATTDVGKVRKANEDSMAVFETANMKVFVVCDGMGGHVGGKMASETAIATIREFLTNHIILDPCEAIHNAIIAANEAILIQARQQPELTGMGSTIVMLVVTSDGKVYYGHVGDSRIYINANHILTALTEDHSVVYEMFKAGIIKTREEMEHHPRKNEITNALGLQRMSPPTLCALPIYPEAGNCFLLCSDGLTGMVADEQIKRIISKHEISIQERAETLIQTANENGGVDNVTAILVEFAVGAQQISGGSTPPPPPSKPTPWKNIAIIVLAVLLVLSVAGWFLYPKLFSKNGDDKPQTETVVTEIPTAEYITTSVGFIRNETVIANIQELPDNVAFEVDSITVKPDISIEKIEGAYITIKWGEYPPLFADTIVVTCRTTEQQPCIIRIPLINDNRIKDNLKEEER